METIEKPENVRQWLAWGFGTVLLVIVSAVWYQSRQENWELYHYDNSSKWEWHDRERGLQISVMSDGTAKLRKIYENGNLIVEVSFCSKVVEGKATTAPPKTTGLFCVDVIWPQDCKPGVEVDTGRTFSGGSPMKLRCLDFYLDGTGVVWSGAGFRGDPPEDSFFVRTNFELDFDGFSVNVPMREFDYKVLSRYWALSRNKTQVSLEKKLSQ